MGRIIVCLKGVPKPGTVKVDPEKHTLRRESAELILNPPDRSALEVALRLKDQANFEVIAISMGPPNAVPILQQAYALGVDELFLVSDRIFAGSDTLATSRILAKALSILSPFDLVIMGARSVDGETGQVPPETASLLNLPSITYVKDLTFSRGKFVALKEDDFGDEEVEFYPPAIVSIVPELDYVRPPSLKRLLSLKEITPKVLTNADLNLEESSVGLTGSPTQVVDVFEKTIVSRGEMYEGEAEELVERFILILKEKGLLV